MTIELAKGVRDFPPEEKMLRQDVTDTLRRIFESFGFLPLETPALERIEVLTAKYGAGEESDAMKEVFKLEDQGGRKLGLHFDLTVPLARFIAIHPEIKFPFKRYQMEKVWRDGPIKLGRYREFWQCDVDTIGTASMLADAELLAIAHSAFTAIGLDVTIDLNNRKVLNGILEEAGVMKTKREQAITVIDKFKKLSKRDLEKEFDERGIGEDIQARLFPILGTGGRTNEDVIANLKRFIASPTGKEGIAEMEELLSYAKGFGITSIRVTPSLARGLAYYTGPVFEGFLKDERIGITSSVCGGGRYDDMIGKYVGRKTVVPATGISFGLEPISEALKEGKKLSRTLTQVYVIPIGTTQQCIPVVTTLRRAGINTDMDLARRGVSKNLQYANAYAIPYVLLIGEDELKDRKVKLRDMKRGEERIMSIHDVQQHLTETFLRRKPRDAVL